MFNTSADILNLVLAASIAALAFFLCWAIYYLVVSVQKIFKLVKRIESIVIKVEEIIDTTKSKIKNSSAYFMILAEVAKRAVDMIQSRRQEKRNKKASAKK